MSALSRLVIAANFTGAIWLLVAVFLASAEPVPSNLFDKPAKWETATYEFPSPQGYSAGTGDHVSITISHSTFQANNFSGNYRYSGTKKTMTVRFGQQQYDIDFSKLDDQFRDQYFNLRNGTLHFALTCIRRPKKQEGYNYLLVIVPWRNQNGSWKLVKFFGDYGGTELVDFNGSDEALFGCEY